MQTADESSIKTNTQKQHAAPNLAVEKCIGVKLKRKRYAGKSDVYCLTVPKTGNFIANGLVIKNCDALRYALFSHGFGKELKTRTAHQLDCDYLTAMGYRPDLPAPFREPLRYY